MSKNPKEPIELVDIEVESIKSKLLNAAELSNEDLILEDVNIRTPKQIISDQNKLAYTGLTIATNVLGIGGIAASGTLKAIGGNIPGAISTFSGVINPMQRFIKLAENSNSDISNKPSRFSKFVSKIITKIDNTKIGNRIIQGLSDTYDKFQQFIDHPYSQKVINFTQKLLSNRLFKKSIKIASAVFLLAAAASNPITLVAAGVSIGVTVAITVKEAFDIKKSIDLEKKRNLLLDRNHNNEIKKHLIEQVSQPGLEILHKTIQTFLKPVEELTNTNTVIPKVKFSKVGQFIKTIATNLADSSGVIINAIQRPEMAAAAAISTLAGVEQDAESNINRRIVNRNLQQQICDLNDGGYLLDSYKTHRAIIQEDIMRTQALEKLIADPSLSQLLLNSEPEKALQQKLQSNYEQELANQPTRSLGQQIIRDIKAGANYVALSQFGEFTKSPYGTYEKFHDKIEKDLVTITTDLQQDYNIRSQTVSSNLEKVNINKIRTFESEIQPKPQYIVKAADKNVNNIMAPSKTPAVKRPKLKTDLRSI